MDASLRRVMAIAGIRRDVLIEILIFLGFAMAGGMVMMEMGFVPLPDFALPGAVWTYPSVPVWARIIFVFSSMVLALLEIKHSVERILGGGEEM